MIRKKIILTITTFLLAITGVVAQKADSVTTVSLSAMAGLKFNKARFSVKPGSRVKLIYTNTDDMSHNLVITKPGARLTVVNAALKLDENGPAMNYIPKSPQVLWSISVLSPSQVKTILFMAPTESGVYPYVCTYPGHGFTMYGAMYVTADGKMPDMQDDPNVPSSAKNDIAADSKGMNMDHMQHQAKIPAQHPYTQVAPYLNRVFMDDASPAAIAVCLPQDLSYCWDAGTCRLRYAWAGGFVDNTALWKGHADAVSKIIGTIFFRDRTIYPLRIGEPDAILPVKFKGYRFINKYPEFHYTLSGVDVYELILPKEDGSGLIRTFKIPGATKTVWFAVDTQNGTTTYESSTGKWDNGKLKLSATEAHEFTITMTNYSLIYSTKTKKKS